MKNTATRPHIGGGRPTTVLLLQQDVFIRTSIAEYLRICGYRVFEALSTDEAIGILEKSPETIGVVLSDAENGFALSRWTKTNRPKLRVILAASVERTARAAANLCDSGPQGKRPYDPQLLVQRIKVSQAGGDGSSS